MSLAQAQRLLNQGRHDEALAVAVRLPKRDEKRAAIILSQIHQARGESADARDVLQRAIKRAPSYLPLHIFLGTLLLDQNDLPGARAAFSRVCELESHNDLARCYLALTMLRIGEREPAFKLLQGDAISDNRMFMVRLTEWMENQWLTSDEFFSQRLVQIEPAPKMGRRKTIRLATRAFYGKDFPKVLQLVGPLVEGSDPDEGHLFACAISSEMLCDYDRALGFVSRFSPADEMPDAIRAVKARSLLRLRRYSEAADEIKKVLIIGPDDFGINYALALLCLAHGNHQRARTLFLRAYTDYIVDSLEYQFWQLQNVLFAPALAMLDPH